MDSRAKYIISRSELENCSLNLICFLSHQRPKAVTNLVREGKLGDVLLQSDAVVLKGDEARVQAPVSARQLPVQLADSPVICEHWK